MRVEKVSSADTYCLGDDGPTGPAAARGPAHGDRGQGRRRQQGQPLRPGYPTHPPGHPDSPLHCHSPRLAAQPHTHTREQTQWIPPRQTLSPLLAASRLTQGEEWPPKPDPQDPVGDRRNSLFLVLDASGVNFLDWSGLKGLVDISRCATGWRLVPSTVLLHPG